MPATAVILPDSAPLPDDRAARRRTYLLLGLILVVASALRLPGLDRLPAGLQQDEAANEWNAYCLLKTGCDQVGVRWPIFYIRALGENRSTLFVYLLLPFQALGGLNLWTGRLPAALGGILTVWLVYWVGARLLGRAAGLTSAALLTVNPVHLQMSRWGHEANVTPLLTLLPLAVWLWAGLPLADAPQRPRPWRALLGGLATGIGCYGYPAIRLFVPVLLVVLTLVAGRAWRELLRTRAGRATTAALAAGFLVTFGPLAYMHILHPDVIGKRGQMTWAWKPGDPPAERVRAVAERYLAHFNPVFLYDNGDVDEIVWAVRFGFLPRYVAPLHVLGVALLLTRVRRSRAARLLLLGILIYPVGDSLNWHVSLHALRSSAGLVYLILPAGLGLTAVFGWLARARLRASLISAGVAVVALVGLETATFLHTYIEARPRKIPVYHGNHVDLLAACAWLRPRLPAADAVICTQWHVNQPHLILMVGLGYDPHAWFAEPRVVYERANYWDRYARVGRLYFPVGDELPALLASLRANGRADRVLLLLRLGEADLGPPDVVLRDPDNQEPLLLYDRQL
jgi:4-amino-4-deoxy-L-arabinose transferase-like glycosyltransferase